MMTITVKNPDVTINAGKTNPGDVVQYDGAVYMRLRTPPNCVLDGKKIEGGQVLFAFLDGGTVFVLAHDQVVRTVVTAEMVVVVHPTEEDL